MAWAKFYLVEHDRVLDIRFPPHSAGRRSLRSLIAAVEFHRARTAR